MLFNGSQQLGWLTTLLVLIGYTVAAQAVLIPHPPTRAEVAAEAELWEENIPYNHTKIIVPNLPPVQVRTMAEWEEVAMLVITWTGFKGVLAEIVRYAVEECEVLIVTNDEIGARNDLLRAGVPLSRVRFLNRRFNSIWIRDYGPWAVYQNKVDSLAISDYLYDRLLRTDDDNIPNHVAQYLGLPLYNADDNPYRWIHAGGNFLRDGMGTGFSSDLVLRENPGKSGRELSHFAKVFFGMDDYRIFPRLPYDSIHHLDMHMRTLDEETIAIGQYPEGVADGPQIEANITWLRNHYLTPYNRPYRILRLPMPPQGGHYPPESDYQTYTNAIFVNKTLLVPIYGQPEDSLALATYQEYLPGYRVVGIDCSSMIAAVGALHCISKVVGVHQPLLIQHARLRDVYEGTADYEVKVKAYHQSGISKVQLYWRKEGGIDYELVPMENMGNNNWSATIPAQAPGIKVQYYLVAQANNGKQQYRPLVAPEGYYHFDVKPYNRRPQVKWLQELSYAAPGTNIRFVSDVEGGATDLLWQFPGGEPQVSFSEQIEVSYEVPGTYGMRLRATNPVGQYERLDTRALQILPVRREMADKFSTVDLSDYWRVDNEHTHGSGWKWTAEAMCSEGALRIDHHAAREPLGRAFLRTAIDLRAAATAQLFMRMAYAPGLHAGVVDEFRVHVTDQEGRIHNVYNKGGSVLATAAPQVAPFVPQSCTDWRTDQVDLSPWIGQQVVLTFETVSERGNSFYLDEVLLVANQRPVISLSTPAADTCWRSQTPVEQVVNIVADVEDDSETVNVDFYINNQFVGSDMETPYEMSFTMSAFGDYCIQARAEDAEGGVTWLRNHCVCYAFGPTNVEGPTPDFEAELLPNIVTDQCDLRIANPQGVLQLDMRVIAANGQLVYQKPLQIFSGTFNEGLPAAPWPAGTYWVYLKGGGQQLRLPFVKQ